MPGDWAGFFERLRVAGRELPWGAGKPKPHPSRLALVHPREKGVAAFYGSSQNFAVAVRVFHRDLVVPERKLIPYFKAGLDDGWAGAPPRPGETCPHCLGLIAPPEPDAEGDRPEPTVFVCPRCHASGYDDALAGQRALAGLPPPERRQAAPGGAGRRGGRPGSKSRRERRAERFAAAATGGAACTA